MIALALLASTPFLASPPAGLERITPQVAAERVTRCGVGKVAIRSDAELDSDVLVISGAGPISEQTLTCIEKAASFYDVELPPAIQPRFNAMREVHATTWMTAESRNWLAAEGLLDRLPTYKPGITNDTIFPHEVETLCHAKGSLSSKYGVHALSPDWVIKRMKTKRPNDDMPMNCLISVTVASGYNLEFIGNAKVAP